MASTPYGSQTAPSSTYLATVCRNTSWGSVSPTRAFVHRAWRYCSKVLVKYWVFGSAPPSLAVHARLRTTTPYRSKSSSAGVVGVRGPRKLTAIFARASSSVVNVAPRRVAVAVAASTRSDAGSASSGSKCQNPPRASRRSSSRRRMLTKTPPRPSTPAASSAGGRRVVPVAARCSSTRRATSAGARPSGTRSSDQVTSMASRGANGGGPGAPRSFQTS